MERDARHLYAVLKDTAHRTVAPILHRGRGDQKQDLQAAPIRDGAGSFHLPPAAVVPNTDGCFVISTSLRRPVEVSTGASGDSALSALARKA